MTRTRETVQVWVCPRNPDHPKYESPVPIVAAGCKECIKSSLKYGDKVDMVLQK